MGLPKATPSGGPVSTPAECVRRPAAGRAFIDRELETAQADAVAACVIAR